MCVFGVSRIMVETVNILTRTMMVFDLLFCDRNVLSTERGWSHHRRSGWRRWWVGYNTAWIVNVATIILPSLSLASDSQYMGWGWVLLVKPGVITLCAISINPTFYCCRFYGSLWIKYDLFRKNKLLRSKSRQSVRFIVNSHVSIMPCFESICLQSITTCPIPLVAIYKDTQINNFVSIGWCEGVF